jgi:NADPH-dependent glutamate synthase beta subunit-like oxidoreductase
LRLGAESVRIVYRRTLPEMPAIREEIDQALDENVELLQLLLPVGLAPIDKDEAGRPRYSLTCRAMEPGEPDSSGRRRPIEIEGSDLDLLCHRVILALGQAPDLSVFPEGTEVREEHQLIGLLENPIFAIGDLATGDGTIAGAIGSGRRAAFHIHETLSGELIDERVDRKTSDRVDVWSDEVVRPESMRLHLFERQAAVKGESLMPWQRTWNFEEIHSGLPDLDEAKRCLSCGGCNECDRCVTYCPEGVLKRVGSAFEFDYSFCKGCGVCAAECPRNVIFMSHL